MLFSDVLPNMQGQALVPDYKQAEKLNEYFQE